MIFANCVSILSSKVPPNRAPIQTPVKCVYQGALSRRTLLHGSTLLSLSLLSNVDPAHGALLLFPVTKLQNRYFLVRAGESETEAENLIDTNPVNKTSMSNGLSPTGKKQVIRESYTALRDLGACIGSCWIWPSTTQNAYQTAEILAYKLTLGRERIVPEYSFLDMRGLGAFDRLTPTEAYEKIHGVDLLNSTSRPPPTTTGTPNESALDVLIRVRQLMSVLETQYNGQDVIIVSPDSENLSVLQTAVLGEETGLHWKRAFRPGEVRALQLAENEVELVSGRVSCNNPPNCF
eukprot:g9072.t1